MDSIAYYSTGDLEKREIEKNTMAKGQAATMLRVDEAHDRFGKNKISRAGFYAAIRRNEVPNIKLGRRILIPRRAFEEFLRGNGGRAA
jgi:excisionase family DNA binding protein